jgi:hypothetical protein
MDPLKPGDPGVVGRYRLSARLDRAGLGTVFLGRAPGGDHVTVKLVRPDLASDDTFMERFRKDATTAREVGGTHVAHVLDADPDGTPPWLVAEHVAGPSLEEAVATGGALPERTLRALGAGLAEGLAAIHAADLTHRDLKPANVLLGADGPRIADYWLARALGSAGMTRTGVTDIPGLPAPEQVTGGSIGPAIDVFALGGVLCHAAGVAPFGEGSAAEIAQKVVRQAPKLTELPDWLREIVTDCLKKRPTARPSAADLVERFAAQDDAEAEPADWLPAKVAALVTARTAEVRAGVPGGDGDTEDAAAPTDEGGSGESAAAGGGSADGADAADDAGVGADDADDADDAGKAAPGAGGSRAADDADDAAAAPDEDEDEPETAEVPALAAIVAAEAAEIAAASDETPVATPAVRVAKDDAAPVAKGAKAAEDGAPEAASAKSAPVAEDPASDDAEADATPAATPATSAAKGAKSASAAKDDDAEASADAGPVSTAAAKPGKGDRAGKAASAAVPEPEPDPEPVEDDEADAAPAAPPAAAAPGGGKGKKAPYDGATPAVVPAVKRGTAAETVKVDRKETAPAAPPSSTDAPTEVVRPMAAPAAPPARAATSPVSATDAPTEVVRPNQFPAPPIPNAAQPNAAHAAAPYADGAAGAAAAPREPREANPVIWYAVIALLGLTAAGLGLFRVTDSEWREAQNSVMGVILPGVSIVCGIAGIATLALAVLSARRQNPQSTPGSVHQAPPTTDHAASGTDALR